jgi:hypothetical protein
VTGVPQDGQVALAWTAPTSDGGSPITGYTVTAYAGSSVEGTQSFSSTTATFTGLTDGTAYTFVVAATNSLGTGAGSAPSAPVTPATVPGAPTSVTAAAYGPAAQGEVEVSWTAPTSDGGSAITSYTIVPYFNGTAQAPVVVSASSTTAIVSGLVVGELNYFTVTATNAMGSGPVSAQSPTYTFT